MRSRTPPSLRQRYCVPHLHDFSMRFELSSKVLRMRTHAQNPVWSDYPPRTCYNLTARPLFSLVYLNRTCANSANSAILIIKMLEMIGIMQKLHLYHRLVEKHEYLFYFIIFFFFFTFQDDRSGSSSYDRTSLLCVCVWMCVCVSVCGYVCGMCLIGCV